MWVYDGGGRRGAGTLASSSGVAVLVRLRPGRCPGHDACRHAGRPTGANGADCEETKATEEHARVGVWKQRWAGAWQLI